MLALVLVAALAASGAADAPAPQPPPTTAKAPDRSVTVPTARQIMAIPPQLQALLHERVIAPGGSRQARVQRLVALVFDPDGLAVEYDNERTRTVAEAWRDRRANCLSYTLLFVALARAAGLDAQVQEVGEVLAWYRDEGVIYSANHVNAGIRTGIQHQTLDVDRNILATRNRPRGVSDARALAHFHNNRGAELMAAGDLAGARASLEAALRADSRFVPVWNNLGVLLQRQDDPEGARHALQAARMLEPDHAATLANLVALHQRQGQPQLAAQYAARLDRVQRGDPFHQFMRALECEDAGDYDCAIARYRNAIRSQSGEHQFHFGLARAYFLSGRLDRAEGELRRALVLAGDAPVRAIYRGKLAHLRRWRANQAGQARHTR